MRTFPHRLQSKCARPEFVDVQLEARVEIELGFAKSFDDADPERQLGSFVSKPSKSIMMVMMVMMVMLVMMVILVMMLVVTMVVSS